jgi:uncharacterized SAM-binding protein YcdF (DUF218 family)
MNDAAVLRLFVRHEPRPADLAIVFGYHVPAGAAARARRAARLFLDGVVPRLLFTGGAPHEPGQDAEAVRMARVALEAGVPALAVLIEPDSDNTFQNVVFSREMLDKLGLLRGLRSVLAVSCPWHMGRVLRVMKKCFPAEVEVRACPHEEQCCARSWRRSADCVRRVRHEAAFLDLLIRQGALPAEV